MYVKTRNAMISMPMNGLSSEEVAQKYLGVKDYLESLGYAVVNTLFDDVSEDELAAVGIANTPVWYLAKSLDQMSRCDTVYFCKGWRAARGCKIEHEVAKQYGITMLYE